MDQEKIQAASDLLARHWEAGTKVIALPDGLRPETRQEGYAIQARLEERSDEPLFGWKIAATSLGGQAHIAVDGPLAGRLLAGRAYESGAERSLRGNRMRVAEPEFAFRMGQDLPPRPRPYGPEEVIEAVETLHPAIELPDSRFEDFTAAGEAQLIADNACAHEFLLGPAAAVPWRGLDLAAHAVRGVVAGRLERDGSGAEVLGDPRLALAWLANELSGLGITLGAGQVVTTGTCLAPLPIHPGDEVLADFGVLGRATVRLAG